MRNDLAINKRINICMKNNWEMIRDTIYEKADKISMMKNNGLFLDYEKFIKSSLPLLSNIKEKDSIEIMCVLVGDMYYSMISPLDTERFLSNPTFPMFYDYLMKSIKLNLYTSKNGVTEIKNSELTCIFNVLTKCYNINKCIIGCEEELLKVNDDFFREIFKNGCLDYLDFEIRDVTKFFLEKIDDTLNKIEDMIINY